MRNKPPNRECDYCNEQSLEAVEQRGRNSEGARVFFWRCSNGDACPNVHEDGHPHEEEATREGGPV